MIFVVPALAGRVRRASCRPFVRPSVRSSIRQHLPWVSCERNSSNSFVLIILKLYTRVFFMVRGCACGLDIKYNC